MRETILAHIYHHLQYGGNRPNNAEVMHHLFQEALETATGVERFEGLAGYVPATEETAESIDRNIDPVLTASAIAFAGTEIADAIRTGLREIAEATEARNE